MKRDSIHATVAALSVATILLNAGCREREMSSNQPAKAIELSDDEALNDVAARVGLEFPTHTVLLNATSGGGRDQSYEFNAWALYSTNRIEMPPLRVMGDKKHMSLPLDNTVRYVEAKLRGRRILNPQSAVGTEWETNGYTFRGTLVRSTQCDYLVIEQFRKR